MRTFALDPKVNQKTEVSDSRLPVRATFRQCREATSISQLVRPAANQMMRRLEETESRDFDGHPSTTTEAPHFGHDFSQIPIDAPTARGIQTKLSINQAGDEYEQEADSIAAQVLSPQARCAVACPPPGIQRFPAQPTGHLESAPPSVDRTLADPGSPLEPWIREDMEQRFARDFSTVRVHSGPPAEQSARDVGALAYTAGEHIVFSASRYAPGTDAGRRLLAHELTHVVQQRGRMGQRLQRSPGGKPTAQVKTLQPLEVVAQRLARLSTSAEMEAVNLAGGTGPVISVVRNTKTGQIYVGFNFGTPKNLTKPMAEAIEAHKQRIATGDVKVVHTAADAVGGHAEVNALNSAIADEQVALGRAMTAEEIGATFEMHNIWLKGQRQLTTAPRCEHCKGITSSVRVTESLFKAEFVAEGGASGEIKIPQRGQATKSGGRVVEKDTIHGEIPSAKPPPVPEQVTKTVAEADASVAASIGRSAVKAVVTEIALNVAFFVITYYINKWYNERQLRQFRSDLTKLLPQINSRLKNKNAEILEKAKDFPLVYGNITIVYTKDRFEPDDYNEGSMSIQDVTISHLNYQTSERKIGPDNPMLGGDPSYTLTFSVPLFEEKEAEKGASSTLSTYRKVRERLTDPAYKVRLSSVLALHKLAKQDSSLETLVVRDLLGRLKDEDSLVRLVAAVSLTQLKAKIAIPYIKEAIAITSDDKKREMMQRYLRDLEGG